MAEEQHFRSEKADDMLAWLIRSACTFAVFFFWLYLYSKAPDAGIVKCFGLPVGPLPKTEKIFLGIALTVTGVLAAAYLARFFSLQSDLRKEREEAPKRKQEEAAWQEADAYLARLHAEVEEIRRKEKEERRKRKEDIARKHEVAEAKRREQKEREREERDRQKREEEWKRWVQEHERAVAERLGKRNLTENTQTAHLAAAPSAEHLASTALAASGSEQYTSEAPAAENAESAEPADSEEERKALEDFFKI